MSDVTVPDVIVSDPVSDKGDVPTTWHCDTEGLQVRPSSSVRPTLHVITDNAARGHTDHSLLRAQAGTHGVTLWAPPSTTAKNVDSRIAS